MSAISTPKPIEHTPDLLISNKKENNKTTSNLPNTLACVILDSGIEKTRAEEQPNKLKNSEIRRLQSNIHTTEQESPTLNDRLRLTKQLRQTQRQIQQLRIDLSSSKELLNKAINELEVIKNALKKYPENEENQCCINFLNEEAQKLENKIPTLTKKIKSIEETQLVEAEKQEINIKNEINIKCPQSIYSSSELEYIEAVQHFANHQEELTLDVKKRNPTLTGIEADIVLKKFDEKNYDTFKRVCHLTAIVFIESMKQGEFISDQPDISLRQHDMDAARAAAMTPFTATRLLIKTTEHGASHDFVLLNLDRMVLLVQSNIYGRINVQDPGGIIELSPKDVEKLFQNDLETFADLFEFSTRRQPNLRIEALDNYSLRSEQALPPR